MAQEGNSSSKSQDEDVAYIITGNERSALHGAATTRGPAGTSPAPDAQPSTERALLEAKLSPAVLAAFDCWKTKGKDCKLAPDGAIEIQLFLTKDPAAVIEQLRDAGLGLPQVRPKEKVVIGRLAPEKLIAIVSMETVMFVTPVRR